MRVVLVICLGIAFCLFGGVAKAQEPFVRIAKIVVDSSQIEQYKLILREGIETAVKLEKGVLRMYAVYERGMPNYVTVFETYASKEAYETHIKTVHFQKYKTETLKMVKSLELIDVVPIIFSSKNE